MIKWEYFMLSLVRDFEAETWECSFPKNQIIKSLDEIMPILNKIGSEGWELTGTTSHIATHMGTYGNDPFSRVRTSNYRYYFKRSLGGG